MRRQKFFSAEPDTAPDRIPKTAPGIVSKPVQGVRNRRLRRIVPAHQAPPAAPPALRVSILTADIGRFASAWILDGQSAGWSPRAIEHYQFITGRLVWWLTREGAVTCGADEIRGFLIYARTSHTLPDGRWGGYSDKPEVCQRRFKPLAPSSVKNYWRNLRAFFNWLVAQDKLDKSPVETVKEPIVRDDQIRPFTADEIKRLVAAAKGSFSPLRDVAVIHFFLDTGVRVSEICALQYRDVDIDNRSALIRHGKGGKARPVYWSSTTARSIAAYLSQDGGREPDNPLFCSESGTTVGAALTRGGMQKVIVRLGNLAGLEMVRCSPHTFRHTFATMYLLAGGDPFSLQQRLGHENASMTQRYVTFAKADMAVQARQFSPVANLKKIR